MPRQTALRLVSRCPPAARDRYKDYTRVTASCLRAGHISVCSTLSVFHPSTPPTLLRPLAAGSYSCTSSNAGAPRLKIRRSLPPHLSLGRSLIPGSVPSPHTRYLSSSHTDLCSLVFHLPFFHHHALTIIFTIARRCPGEAATVGGAPLFFMRLASTLVRSQISGVR